MRKLVTVCVIALCIFCTKSWAQNFSLAPKYYTVFNPDSLVGFDEAAARQAAIDEGFLGSEFKVRMYNLKRDYIDQKYNIVRTGLTDLNSYLDANRPAPVPGCVNEDFEASTPAVITASNQINGWTVVGGYNGGPNGPQGANSCNLLGCCPLQPSKSALIDCSGSGGFVDSQIGSQYPIYSVFGSGPANAAALAANPQLSSGMSMYGDKILRLNDGLTSDWSMEKLSKTFAVTASNALFQFAFLSVFGPEHGCCEAGGFQIRLSNATANTVIPCPNFSVSAPSGACTATVPVTYFIGTGSQYAAGTTYTNQSGVLAIYNRWKINSMDLSAYIGQNITIDIIVADCNAGGHYGKVYFDAQCGPMVINGNGIDFDAGVTNVLVPTCGAAGATICAAAGLGPYSWAGPNLPSGYTVPSMTNQCMTSTISATYTLFMQPEGACQPIPRVVTSTITPAPLLVASAVQAPCGSTLAIVSVTPSGSAANPSSLTWFPTPLTLNTNSTLGNYQIPIGPLPTIVSVTASDPLGCLVTATVNVNPAPPYPTFTIVNVTGSSSITCAYPTINLDAQTTYSYNNGSLNFFWASNSATFSTSNVVITNAGVYTVNAVDPVTNCGITQTVAIGINTLQPSSVISPSNQVINCNLSSITNVTATISQTVNVSQSIMSPQGSTLTSNSYSMIFLPGSVGTFTHCALNEVNGCQTCKEFTVQSNQGFPTFGLTSPENFTLGCNSKSVTTINIINGSATGTNQVPNGGPVSYTILGPPTSTAVPVPPALLGSASSYTVNTPGTWTIVVRDNTNFCESRVYQSVLQNTFGPHIAVSVPQRILDCNIPKVIAVGQSTTAGVGFLWSFPGTPGNQPGDTISIFTNTAAPTSSVIANYTLTNTDLNSTCKSTTIIPMFQSLYVPKAIVTNGGVNAISCKVYSLVLTNQSSSTIPPSTGFSNGFPVVGFLWKGPSPQIEESNVSTYNAFTPGTYTMIVKDMNNGCVNFTTITIEDQRDFPVINPGSPTRVLDCAAKFAVLNPTISAPAAPSTPADLVYFWDTEVPEPNLDGQDKVELHPGKPGEYLLLVTNTKNGCKSQLSMNVINGTLTPLFDPDVISGVAPLTVNFKNKSTSSLGNSGISSVWSFGNGKFGNMPNVKDTAATYTQPGSYTVTLYVNKGQCLETIRKVINVEIPSKIIVPNIFTPNGDHVNDLFHLQATNLSSITAVIIDRWGNIVYELTSNTGNIAWDGKNQKGMDVSEGVYFYTIKATGNDGVEFNKTGTITLTR